MATAAIGAGKRVARDDGRKGFVLCENDDGTCTVDFDVDDRWDDDGPEDVAAARLVLADDTEAPAGPDADATAKARADVERLAKEHDEAVGRGDFKAAGALLEQQREAAPPTPADVRSGAYVPPPGRRSLGRSTPRVPAGPRSERRCGASSGATAPTRARATGSRTRIAWRRCGRTSKKTRERRSTRCRRRPQRRRAEAL